MGRNLFYTFYIFMIFFLITSLQAQENPRGKIDYQCMDCHTSSDWHKIATAGFDHGQTGFALLGTHKKTACGDSHKSLVFSAAGKACIACNTDVHTAEWGENYLDCHTQPKGHNDLQMRE